MWAWSLEPWRSRRHYLNHRDPELVHPPRARAGFVKFDFCGWVFKVFF